MSQLQLSLSLSSRGKSRGEYFSNSLSLFDGWLRSDTRRGAARGQRQTVRELMCRRCSFLFTPRPLQIKELTCKQKNYLLNLFQTVSAHCNGNL